MLQDWPDSESGSTITVVQEVRSPRIPDQVDVMTVVVSHPPGARGHLRIAFPVGLRSVT